MCAEWAEKNLPRLSLATRADAAEILDIYNWYVLHHTATFQVTPLPCRSMRTGWTAPVR